MCFDSFLILYADSENKMFYSELLLQRIVLFYSSFFSCAVGLHILIVQLDKIDAKSYFSVNIDLPLGEADGHVLKNTLVQ